MDVVTQHAEALRRQIVATEEELRSLKEQLAGVEAQNSVEKAFDGVSLQEPRPVTQGKWPLSAEEYKRYGRQMIVPNIGIQGQFFSNFIWHLAYKNVGQLRLKAASVLIVGAGGLGCPAAAYIAGAGVGTIGIVDGDAVETSNLHRQILHSTSKVGIKKVDSAIEFLTSYVWPSPFLFLYY